jgi:SAM-dependent methyltransferase
VGLKYYFIKTVRKLFPLAFLEPEGDRGIARIGHREYVGGNWDEIGSLQFEFLRSKGLQPESYLLDIACGSLRLGVKAIPFLLPDHYLGIEKEPGLVEAGLNDELGSELQEAKRPRIVISDSFEFERLGQPADIAISQSLFSHLPPQMIHQCFRKLLPCLKAGGVFYATYFEVPTPRKNPEKPHDHGYFAYTASQMLEFGESNGFSATYIGDWNHPRDQVIVEYRKPQ